MEKPIDQILLKKLKTPIDRAEENIEKIQAEVVSTPETETEEKFATEMLIINKS